MVPKQPFLVADCTMRPANASKLPQNGPQSALHTTYADTGRAQTCHLCGLRNGLKTLGATFHKIQEYFWENTFLTHFDLFFVPKWTILGYFGTFWGGGAKWASNGPRAFTWASQVVWERVWKKLFLTQFAPLLDLGWFGPELWLA